MPAGGGGTGEARGERGPPYSHRNRRSRKSVRGKRRSGSRCRRSGNSHRPCCATGGGAFAALASQMRRKLRLPLCWRNGRTARGAGGGCRRCTCRFLNVSLGLYRRLCSRWLRFRFVLLHFFFRLWLWLFRRLRFAGSGAGRAAGRGTSTCSSIASCSSAGCSIGSGISCGMACVVS